MKQHLDAVVLTASNPAMNVVGEFWQQYADWHIQISQKVTELIGATQQVLAAKLLMLPLTSTDVEKVNSLWLNPIINPRMQSFDPQILTLLLQSRLLSVRQAHAGPIFVCEDILSMYEQLDNLLLLSK